MSTRSKFLISIIGFLILQEIVLRLCFPVPELSNFDRGSFVTKKNEFQGGFVRNRSFLWWSIPDTSAPFQLNYNRYGFRDQNWSVTKAEGFSRVMFVGDSFIEGIMAADDQTIPVYFEKAASDNLVEAMNFGMLGTGLEEYLQLIADAVPIFRPDKVVLSIYANDFTLEQVQIPEFYLSEKYTETSKPRILELIKQYKAGNPIPFVFQTNPRAVLPDSSQPTYPFHTRINEMYQHADSSLVSDMLMARFNPYKLNEIMRMETALKQPVDFRNALGFFKYYSDKFDFEPLVVFIPCRHQLTDHYLQFEYAVSKGFDRNIRLTDSVYQVNHLHLQKSCDELGLKFINLSDTLAQMEHAGVRAYWNYDDHMKPAGYRAIGTYIAEHWD